MEENEISVTDEVTDEPGEQMPAEEAPPEQSSDGEVDYGAILEADIGELKRAFPELADIESICELNNPVRFGALRDLGLTPEEAYLASGGRKRTYDNRTHLTATVPSGARSGADSIPRGELEIARELFEGMSESEIQKLYRKVTK